VPADRDDAGEVPLIIDAKSERAADGMRAMAPSR